MQAKGAFHGESVTINSSGLTISIFPSIEGITLSAGGGMSLREDGEQTAGGGVGWKI